MSEQNKNLRPGEKTKLIISLPLLVKQSIEAQDLVNLIAQSSTLHINLGNSHLDFATFVGNVNLSLEWNDQPAEAKPANNEMIFPDVIEPKPLYSWM